MCNIGWNRLCRSHSRCARSVASVFVDSPSVQGRAWLCRVVCVQGNTWFQPVAVCGHGASDWALEPRDVVSLSHAAEVDCVTPQMHKWRFLLVLCTQGGRVGTVESCPVVVPIVLVVPAVKENLFKVFIWASMDPFLRPTYHTFGVAQVWHIRNLSPR